MDNKGIGTVYVKDNNESLGQHYNKVPTVSCMPEQGTENWLYTFLILREEATSVIIEL